jgi:hypothetical protein
MVVLTGVVISASVAVACEIAETHYENVVLPARVKSQSITCNSPFVKADLSKLKECGSKEKGKGHCYPASKVPIPASELEPCDAPGEVCTPDKLLVSGGGKAKSCTFFLENKPGACLSIMSKSTYENKDTLKQDTCDPDERCAPCIDPRDGKDTGVCGEGGVHEADCTSGAAADAPECCHMMGLCLAEAGIPEGARGSMPKDRCPEKMLCAPRSQVEGRPVKCEVLGASGVCLDTCFASQFASTKVVSRSSCGPTEICLPCVLANTMGGGQKMLGCE